MARYEHLALPSATQGTHTTLPLGINSGELIVLPSGSGAYPAENLPKSFVRSIRPVPITETFIEYMQTCGTSLTSAWEYAKQKIDQIDWLLGPLALAVEMMANIELAITQTILKSIAITHDEPYASLSVQAATSRAVFGYGGFIFFFNLLLTLKNSRNKYLICSFHPETRNKISNFLIKASTVASTFGLTATTAAFIYVYKEMHGLSDFLGLTLGLSIATSLAHWFTYKQTIFPVATQLQYKIYTHTRATQNFCLSDSMNAFLRKIATALAEVGRFAGLGRIMGRMVEIFSISNPSANKKSITDKTNVVLITSFAFAGLASVILKSYFPKANNRIHQFSVFLRTAIFAYLMADDCISNNQPSFYLEKSPLPLTGVLLICTLLGIVQSNRYTQRAEEKYEEVPLSPSGASSTDSGEINGDGSPNSSFDLSDHPDDESNETPYQALDV